MSSVDIDEYRRCFHDEREWLSSLEQYVEKTSVSSVQRNLADSDLLTFRLLNSLNTRNIRSSIAHFHPTLDYFLRIYTIYKKATNENTCCSLFESATLRPHLPFCFKQIDLGDTLQERIENILSIHQFLKTESHSFFDHLRDNKEKGVNALVFSKKNHSFGHTLIVLPPPSENTFLVVGPRGWEGGQKRIKKCFSLTSDTYTIIARIRKKLLQKQKVGNSKIVCQNEAAISRIFLNFFIPGIVPMNHLSSEDSKNYLSMPFFPEGTIREYLSSTSIEPTHRFKEAFRLCVEMAETLMRIHQHGYVHLDIKPDNFLVQKIDGIAHAYLSDFATTRCVTRKNGPVRMISVCGTFPPPEMLQNDLIPNSPTVDLWAFGETMYQVLYQQSFLITSSYRLTAHFKQRFPFAQFEKAKSRLVITQKPLLLLIANLFSIEPDRRMPIEAVFDTLQHEYLGYLSSMES